MSKYVAVKLDGTTVTAGDTIMDFRGDNWDFVRATSPTRPGKAGKVTVTRGGSNMGEREFYATVFDLIVKDVTS